jgi:NADH-quinone oxidoreductase subunit L
VYSLAIIAVFMTAFYIFRALFMTFEGEFRGGADADPDDAVHGPVHLAESPAVMVWPLGILGVAAVLAGFLANPLTGFAGIPAHWLTEFLGGGFVHVEAASFDRILATVSSVVAAAGIVLAYLMYSERGPSFSWLESRVSPVHNLLLRKYYFDEVYEDLLVTRYFYSGLARSLDWIDRAVIDRVANMVGWLGANFGGALRQAQTGQVQGYGAAISVGIVVILGIYIVFL